MCILGSTGLVRELVLLRELSLNIIVILEVFMSPEIATASPWREMFSSEYFKKYLFMIAVDEAHCITEWLVYNDVYL